jgi:hypothetical protein
VNLEINEEELEYLIELVGCRVRDLHPEIRRSMTYEFKDKLKHELECLKDLLERLKTLQGESD